MSRKDTLTTVDEIQKHRTPEEDGLDHAISSVMDEAEKSGRELKITDALQEVEAKQVKVRDFQQKRLTALQAIIADFPDKKSLDSESKRIICFCRLLCGAGEEPYLEQKSVNFQIDYTDERPSLSQSRKENDQKETTTDQSTASLHVSQSRTSDWWGGLKNEVSLRYVDSADGNEPLKENFLIKEPSQFYKFNINLSEISDIEFTQIKRLAFNYYSLIKILQSEKNLIVALASQHNNHYILCYLIDTIEKEISNHPILIDHCHQQAILNLCLSNYILLPNVYHKVDSKKGVATLTSVYTKSFLDTGYPSTDILMLLLENRLDPQKCSVSLLPLSLGYFNLNTRKTMTLVGWYLANRPFDSRQVKQYFNDFVDVLIAVSETSSPETIIMHYFLFSEMFEYLDFDKIKTLKYLNDLFQIPASEVFNVLNNFLQITGPYFKVFDVLYKRYEQENRLTELLELLSFESATFIDEPTIRISDFKPRPLVSDLRQVLANILYKQDFPIDIVNVTLDYVLTTFFVKFPKLSFHYIHTPLLPVFPANCDYWVLYNVFNFINQDIHEKSRYLNGRFPSAEETSEEFDEFKLKVKNKVHQFHTEDQKAQTYFSEKNSETHSQEEGKMSVNDMRYVCTYSRSKEFLNFGYSLYKLRSTTEIFSEATSCDFFSITDTFSLNIDSKSQSTMELRVKFLANLYAFLQVKGNAPLLHCVLVGGPGDWHAQFIAKSFQSQGALSFYHCFNNARIEEKAESFRNKLLKFFDKPEVYIEKMAKQILTPMFQYLKKFDWACKFSSEAEEEEALAKLNKYCHLICEIFENFGPVLQDKGYSSILKLISNLIEKLIHHERAEAQSEVVITKWRQRITALITKYPHSETSDILALSVFATNGSTSSFSSSSSTALSSSRFG